MFIGHFAVGLAAKRAAPRTSLGWLMAAPMALDLLWPLFLIAGLERVRIAPGDTPFTPLAFEYYPWSHSLLMSVVWGAVFGGAYWAFTKYARGSVVLALGVISHWVLDFITHRADLPLYPGGSALVGLGLWYHPLATQITELAMFLGAAWLYGTFTSPRDRTGKYVFAAFVALWTVIYLTSGSSVPPTVTALAYGSLGGWLVPLWAWWFDAHRSVRLSA